MAEERRLGHGTEASRQGGHQEDPVHQALVVVGGDHERPREGQALEPRHLDAPVEHGDQEARESSEDAVAGRLSQG